MIQNVDPQLSQWDVGRSVSISNSNATHIHFANQGDSKAVIIEITNGTAKIPDYLLHTGKSVIAYAVLNGVTIESKSFPVRKREMPESYVYEDDQRNYIYELISKAEKAVESAGEAAGYANGAANDANEATTKANLAAQNATNASDKANLAAQNANDAATKAVNALKNMTVVGAAKGERITLYDAIEQPLVGLRVFGKTTQNGTPTPDAPVPLASVGDSGSITVNVAGENEAKSMTILTPNGLPGIPVTSGGNYTDANGQQWICDEIDFARSVYVQRIGKYTLVGTSPEKWLVSPVQSVAEAIRFDISAPAPMAGHQMCLCNAFKGVIYSTAGKETCWCSDETTIDRLQFRICTSYVSSVEELQRYLQNNVVTVVYILATHTETPLSAEELAAYANLHTYKDSTTVSNDASAYMELEYVIDARKYIDSMITAGILEATVE